MFHCVYCQFKCSLRADILEHLQVHKGDIYVHKDLQCPFCFGEYLKLVRHARTCMQNPANKLHECDCGCAFAREYDLRRHRNYVHGERAQECGHCQRVFGYKHYRKFQDHVRLCKG
jgi:hypothetical protein